MLILSASRLQITKGWLFYSPVSREQTVEDCKRLQSNQSPFYPAYCNRLLKNVYNITEIPPVNDGSSTSFRPAITLGWGWGQWGQWQEEACPSICGRRCRRRTRACNGPYQLACVGQGKGEEFDDCPALNDQVSTNGFQRSTTVADPSFALYSTNPQSIEDVDQPELLQSNNTSSSTLMHHQNLNMLQHSNNNNIQAASNNGMMMMMSGSNAQDRNFRRRRRRKQIF